MSSASESPPGLPAAAAACAWTKSASVTDLLIGSSSSAATCECVLASLRCRHKLFVYTATLLLLLHSGKDGQPASRQRSTSHARQSSVHETCIPNSIDAPGRWRPPRAAGAPRAAAGRRAAPATRTRRAAHPSTGTRPAAGRTRRVLSRILVSQRRRLSSVQASCASSVHQGMTKNRWLLTSSSSDMGIGRSWAPSRAPAGSSESCQSSSDSAGPCACACPCWVRDVASADSRHAASSTNISSCACTPSSS